MRSNKAIHLVASALLLACGDPLVAPELITSTRVLAMRTEAAGDANRAWVEPSEGAGVRWLVAGPSGSVNLGWSFSACVAQTTSRGLPLCAATPFARVTSTEISTNEPRFEFTMPDATSLTTTPQVAISAAFCTSGMPTQIAPDVDFASTRCPDTSESPLFAVATVSAMLNATTNTNPDLSRVALQFDNVDWPVWIDETAESLSCADTGLSIPRVSAGGASHEILLAVPTDMSELVARVSAHSAARETLNLAHFVTAGDLERAYSTVETTVDPALVRVNWKTPGTVDANGELVRFYFVLRDGRGGADYTTRAVCVTQ